MKHRRIGMLLTVAAGTLCLLVGIPAFGVELTNNTLSVDIRSDGTFGDITVGDESIDTTSQNPQMYLCGAVNGNGNGFTPLSEVNVDGTTATYTAMCGDLEVLVTSRILDPVDGIQVLEQELSFTNPSFEEETVPLAIVSFIDQALGDTDADDSVDGSDATRTVFATDQGTTQLFAASASSGIFDTTFGLDFGLEPDVDRSFPELETSTTDAVTGDTAMALGFTDSTFGMVDTTFGLDPGDMGSIFYRYQFSTNASMPADVIPDTLTVARGENDPGDPAEAGAAEIDTPVTNQPLMQLDLTSGLETVIVNSITLQIDAFGDLNEFAEDFVVTVKVIRDDNGDGVADEDEPVLGSEPLVLPEDDDGIGDDIFDDDEGVQETLTVDLTDPDMVDMMVALPPNTTLTLLVVVDVVERGNEDDDELGDLAEASITPTTSFPNALTPLGWLALLPAALGLVLFRRVRRRFPRLYVGLVLVALLCSLLLVGCPDGGEDEVILDTRLQQDGVNIEGSTSGEADVGGDALSARTLIIQH